ncbi:MAG: Hsp20/alpha crystallin family protein [Spirochaetes bacterium]|nr:Hsp20/alpha crystallin family protein [Spirochaetota bacterium]
MTKIVNYKPYGRNLSPMWNSFFEDFFDITSTTRDDFRRPAVDVIEKEGSYGFEIELPGFTDNEIDVRIEKNVLTIKAERETKEEEKGKNKQIISERVEKYYRTFTLPQNADEEKIEAKFNNGVLALEVFKKDKKEPKKIDIKK